MPQITQLDNDPTPNNNDLLVTVDVGAGTTKNISREQFFTGAPLPADTVDEQAIADGSITPEKRSGGYYGDAVTLSSGTGTKTLTGFGFRPREVQFISQRAAATTALSCIGGAVDVNGVIEQYSIATASAASAAQTASSTTHALNLILPSGVVQLRASVTSFNEDGITLSVVNDEPNSRTWFVIARA